MSGAAPPTVHPGIDSQRPTARPRLIPGGAIGWFVDGATARARSADRSDAVPGVAAGPAPPTTNVEDSRGPVADDAAAGTAAGCRTAGACRRTACLPSARCCRVHG